MLSYPDIAAQVGSSRYPLAMYREAVAAGETPFAHQDGDLFSFASGVGRRYVKGAGQRGGQWDWSVYVRVMPPAGGWLSASLLDALAELVDRRGAGLLHLATGGTLEIYTTPEDLRGLVDELHALGLEVGSTGESLRCLLSCAGPARCDEWVVDAPAIATYLEQRFRDEQLFPGLPNKCKLAVAGCSHDCVRATHRDLALVGVWGDHARRQRGVAFVVGGKYGARNGNGPMVGEVLIPFFAVDEEPFSYQALGDLVERFLNLWADSARNRERVGDFVSRIGKEQVLREMGWDGRGWRGNA